jgi:DNA-damage-inducible protein D
VDREIVVRLHSSFEAKVEKTPDSGTEFWCARELQLLLGYATWENFARVVDKAITACCNSGCDPRDHFREVTKMVALGSGAQREIEDIALTRYACYLIAQNGDPAKEQIAFAQGSPTSTSSRMTWAPSPALPNCALRLLNIQNG